MKAIMDLCIPKILNVPESWTAAERSAIAGYAIELAAAGGVTKASAVIDYVQANLNESKAELQAVANMMTAILHP